MFISFLLYGRASIDATSASPDLTVGAAPVHPISLSPAPWGFPLPPLATISRPLHPLVLLLLQEQSTQEKTPPASVVVLAAGGRQARLRHVHLLPRCPLRPFRRLPRTRLPPLRRRLLPLLPLLHGAERRHDQRLLVPLTLCFRPLHLVLRDPGEQPPLLALHRRRLFSVRPRSVHARHLSLYPRLAHETEHLALCL